MKNGATNSLVAIQRLPNDFVRPLVHHSWRVRYRARVLLCSLEACGAVQSARPLLPESLAAYQSSLATLLPFLLQTGWSGRPNAKSLSRTRGLVSTTQTGSGFKISQRKIRHLEGG